MPAPRWLVALAAVAFALATLLHTLLYSDSWRLRERARADLAGLRSANDAAEHRLEGLRAELEALRTRPEVQERVVRHELGWVKPGELVLDLSGSATARN